MPGHISTTLAIRWRMATYRSCKQGMVGQMHFSSTTVEKASRSEGHDHDKPTAAGDRGIPAMILWSNGMQRWRETGRSTPTERLVLSCYGA